jgi:hypothetical protein
MKSPLTLGLALVLVAGALSGCSKKTSLTDPTTSPGGPGSSVDQAQVSSALAASPDLVEDGVYEDPAQTTLDAGGAGSYALLHPLRFWRTINSIDRTFQFAFSDTDSTGRPTTVRVTYNKYLRGQFDILDLVSGDASAPRDSDSLQVVRKRLADHWVRHILLKRLKLSDGDAPAWHIAATSGVQVTSFAPASPNTNPAYGNTRIQSLRVQASGLDTTITDPLAMFRLRRLLRFEGDGPVTLTATTGANDVVVVLMWAGLRFRFHPNGDGTYTATWTTPMFAHVGHLGVNALSHGTLFDDTAPYDSQAWILPFVVAPTELADCQP